MNGIMISLEPPKLVTMLSLLTPDTKSGMFQWASG
jgi:hypothetical protein